jgi:MYXO-CTERM domain-containing protein
MAILAGATRPPDKPGADIFFGVLLLALGLAFVVLRRRFAGQNGVI